MADTDDARAARMNDFEGDGKWRFPRGRFSGFASRGPNTYARGVHEHRDSM